jgi:hypothetical protein
MSDDWNAPDGTDWELLQREAERLKDEYRTKLAEMARLFNETNERLRAKLIETEAAYERLEDHANRTNSRLRKAVTWLVGALHDESPRHQQPWYEDGPCEVWECMRARAVLKETSGDLS